ncbi:MAG: DUF4292 domain-containing protein [bacterium]
MDLAELGPVGALTRAEAHGGSLSRVRATGSLQVRMDGGSLTAQGILLYAAPDSLRMDVQAFMGTTVARTLLLDDWMELHLPQENVLYQGDLRDRALRSIAGVPLDGAALREVLLGPAAARDLTALAEQVDRFDLGPGTCLIGILLPGGGRLLYRLDDDLRFRSATYQDAAGGVLWETTYTEWKRAGEGLLPTELTWYFPMRGLELTWRVGRRSERLPGSAGDFQLEVPAGVRRLPVGPVLPPEDVP